MLSNTTEEIVEFNLFLDTLDQEPDLGKRLSMVYDRLNPNPSGSGAMEPQFLGSPRSLQEEFLMKEQDELRKLERDISNQVASEFKKFWESPSSLSLNHPLFSLEEVQKRLKAVDDKCKALQLDIETEISEGCPPNEYEANAYYLILVKELHAPLVEAKTQFESHLFDQEPNLQTRYKKMFALAKEDLKDYFKFQSFLQRPQELQEVYHRLLASEFHSLVFRMVYEERNTKRFESEHERLKLSAAALQEKLDAVQGELKKVEQAIPQLTSEDDFYLENCYKKRLMHIEQYFVQELKSQEYREANPLKFHAVLEQQREYEKQQNKEKFLHFALGRHRRAGQGSPVSLLVNDVVGLIFHDVLKPKNRQKP